MKTGEPARRARCFSSRPPSASPPPCSTGSSRGLLRRHSRRPAGALLRRHGDRMEALPGGYWRAPGPRRRHDEPRRHQGQLRRDRARACKACRAWSRRPPSPSRRGGGPGRLVVYAVCRARRAPAERRPAAGRCRSAIRRDLNPLFKIHDVVLIECPAADGVEQSDAPRAPRSRILSPADEPHDTSSSPERAAAWAAGSASAWRGRATRSWRPTSTSTARGRPPRRSRPPAGRRKRIALDVTSEEDDPATSGRLGERAGRRAGQQRRPAARGQGRGIPHGEVGPADGRDAARHVPHDARRAAGHARAGLRPAHPHRLDPLPRRLARTSPPTSPPSTRCSASPRSLALETADADITSNTICPAYIRTPLVDAQIADQARTRGISEDEVIRARDARADAEEGVHHLRGSRRGGRVPRSARWRAMSPGRRSPSMAAGRRNELAHRPRRRSVS